MLLGVCPSDRLGARRFSRLSEKVVLKMSAFKDRKISITLPPSLFFRKLKMHLKNAKLL